MRREKWQMKNGEGKSEDGRKKETKREMGERKEEKEGGEGSKISTFIVGISKKGCR